MAIVYTAMPQKRPKLRLHFHLANHFLLISANPAKIKSRHTQCTMGSCKKLCNRGWGGGASPNDYSMYYVVGEGMSGKWLRYVMNVGAVHLDYQLCRFDHNFRFFQLPNFHWEQDCTEERFLFVGRAEWLYGGGGLCNSFTIPNSNCNNRCYILIYMECFLKLFHLQKLSFTK